MPGYSREWLERNFPCRWACPVHTEAGKYAALIAEGRYREAYAVARAPNPLASICGRICAAPCENVCRRGEIDAPVSIRALKRFVTERFGVESMVDLSVLSEIYGTRSRRYDERVAVVGSGPAGLACAHDLALLGYPVTIFEAQPVAGGMLRLGVPEYRLPRELIKLEINAILSLGVELMTGVRVGHDLSLDQLREKGYRAFFLAVGAQLSRGLQIPGIEADGVLRGTDYLLNVNLGYRVEMGHKVIVIGGGNVAIDVARTAARGPGTNNIERGLSIVQALDVARSAIRFGARAVTVVCLESPDEMPSDPEEVNQALEEGIRLLTRRGPKQIIEKDGVVCGLETLDVARVFDDEGRFNPSFIAGTEKVLDADTIILAIGQNVDLSFIGPDDPLDITTQGTLKVDPVTLATSRPGFFGGGDAAFGPRIAIQAVADGKRAARSIDEYLRGESRPEPSVEVDIRRPRAYDRIFDYESIPRQAPPRTPIHRRIGIAEVEQCYPEAQGRREGQRCLHCWTNTIFEQDPVAGTECLLCGGCMDVCPEDCIELVPVLRADLVACGVPPPARADLDAGGYAGTLIIKNEDTCIRCGLCAARCPAGTITMQSFDMTEAANAR